ncbi:unnamed protein product [Aspergillus oryzae var. brunneus]|uniref:Glycerophosphocholine acyltransferase 1 n=1 Tax=Aspergillus oryzae var. brunneus TaxID=332754 RepID=A0ABQ6L0J4_ASPOZ|nr:unnamed protein product [Aspergillus oryzae var. brunneus]
MGMLTFARFLTRPYPHYRDGPTIFSFQQKLIMEDGASYSTGDSPDLQAIPSDDMLSDLDDVAGSSDSFYSPSGTPRRPSFSYQDDWETFPPLDKLTVFDLLDNFSLSQRLEKLQHTINMQKEKMKKQREKLKYTSATAKDRVVGEFKRRVPTADEQLDKYRRRMKVGVERLGKQWNATATVTLREKISFIAGVLNIFFSGYLIGAHPESFYIWFTVQLAYFMPIRYYRYHAKGYHYFLADLCYFVNLLCMLSIWAFPNSKRLFISAYCLTFGNNAVAIAMWRNSLVFHSMDKVVSLFIHIMPPATWHCIVHLTSAETLKERFPAIYDIKFSEPGSPDHFSLLSMMVWATVPYTIWQLSYHCFITVRRAEQIAAGRPTSFTWLRKSYAKAWIGKIVLSLPESLQAPAFMLIQYFYAILTMIPCPLWLWSRWASGLFLTGLFILSIHNGATYYIDVFGKRFQKELEALKKDVARWQSSPEGTASPTILTSDSAVATGTHVLDDSKGAAKNGGSDKASIDKIPLLDSTVTASVSAANLRINGRGLPSHIQALAILVPHHGYATEQSTSTSSSSFPPPGFNAEQAKKPIVPEPAKNDQQVVPKSELPVTPKNNAQSKDKSSEAGAVKEAAEEKKEQKKLTIGQKIKKEAQHYWDGTKLLATEVKISSRLALKMAAGYELSRREHRQKKALNLSSTRKEVSGFLKDTLKESGLPVTAATVKNEEFAEFFKKIRTTGEAPSTEDVIKVCKVFKDDLTLDNLSRPQLVGICKYMNLNSFGTDAMLRYNIRHRMRQIKRDDRAIFYEGVESLSVPELQMACASRGIRTHGVSPARLRDDLSTWLDLRLKQGVPSTLLVLSNAYVYAQGGKETEMSSQIEALQAVLSSIPEELFHEIELEVHNAEGAATNKQRLEVIKEQQELIEEENEQNSENEEKGVAAPKDHEDIDDKEEVTIEAKYQGQSGEAAEAVAEGEKVEEAQLKDPSTQAKDGKKETTSA